MFDSLFESIYKNKQVRVVSTLCTLIKLVPGITIYVSACLTAESVLYCTIWATC